ncbi:VirB4-like conjugal transfer ATPase, CD1110 family [Lactococcus cremoris]|uniref:VirB4-like conjugal transfer ATPase, CD1110 family n=1 Tax=Lactococcus lactis subsp. cremoris TaxID=1359 RepID=UPI001F35A9A9|nr:DUF87 domain-containing protein [Lactococcus cremoris]
MNIKNLFNQKKSKKQPPLSKHEKLKLKRLKTNANRAKKTSSQNTLKYTSLFENGLMNIVDDNYSMTYELGSTNYATATFETKQTIFEKYNSMINTISDEEHFQLTILVSKVHSKEYQQKNEFELQGDDYDYLREELNHLIHENYQNGYNNYQIDRYITISTKAENKKKALGKLKNTETLLASSLASIEVPIKQQTGLERLSLFNKILNYDKPLYGNFDDIKKSCLTTKDLIAPQSLKFSQSGVEVGERFNQVLYLKEFPMELSDGLFKDLSTCGQELVITIQADPYSIIETSKRLRMQATSIESEVIKQQKIAIKDGYSPDFIGRTAKETQEDLNEVINLVRETGDKQFSSIFLVYITGKTKEERTENSRIIKALGEKYGANFETLDYLQEEALNSVLPIGKNYTDCEKTFQRDLITPNLSVNSPFTTVDINHKKGKFYGINLFSHNIISIDRRDESMDNSNGLITGVSGSGKSMTAKYEIVTTLLNNPKDEVIVLSPDDEYNDLPEKLDGQLIKIAPNTKHHINILDLPKEEDLKDGDDPVGLKSSFLVSLFSSLFESVSEIQESIIDEVTIETYQKHEKPTLLEWYEVLETKTFNNEEALDLTQKIKMYITGSMDIFSKETNVNLNSRFIVYDISQLTTKFKPFGFMALEENIWQRVVKNNAKGITTWVYFDEIQVLLSGKSSEISREKFKDIWSRIRKYGGNPTGITQFIDTVLETPEGRSMFFNSEFIVLLKQKKFAIEIIKQHYNITEQQEQYLKTPKKGSGLIIAGNAIVPFENTIPSSTELYKIMQTD